jgi:hypothetical protein
MALTCWARTTLTQSQGVNHQLPLEVSLTQSLVCLGLSLDPLLLLLCGSAVWVSGPPLHRHHWHNSEDLMHTVPIHIMMPLNTVHCVA